MVSCSNSASRSAKPAWANIWSVVGGHHHRRGALFLENHLKSMVSVVFFVVPTIRFQILYVFQVLAHERRRIVHFAVTAHATAEWTAQQLREAFPWDSAPRYLLRDRDRIFGREFVGQVKAIGIKQVLSTPASPWQRAYVERVIGTIRRECLDHLRVQRTQLTIPYAKFCDYYHRSRTHLGLQKDTSETRPPSSPFQKLVVYIIATNVAPLEGMRRSRATATASVVNQTGCSQAGCGRSAPWTVSEYCI